MFLRPYVNEWRFLSESASEAIQWLHSQASGNPSTIAIEQPGNHNTKLLHRYSQRSTE
jgi:hypothetical protein